MRLDWIHQLFLAHVIHTSSNNCEIERKSERGMHESLWGKVFTAFLFSVSRSMKRKLTTFHWAIIRDWIGFSLRTTNLLNFIIYTKIYLNRNKIQTYNTSYECLYHQEVHSNNAQIFLEKQKLSRSWE